MVNLPGALSFLKNPSPSIPTIGIVVKNQKSKTPDRMQCMEIWGGNRAIDKNFEAPGLDIYVHSSPYEDSPTGGGDIYYLTSCASGRISRFLLADVSGHGEAVSNIAVSLRDLLRENVNRISQEKFVTKMNREFGEATDGSLFATAVVATFFEPKKSLSVSVAGHPYPIYYKASQQTWVHLDPAESDEGLENLPLGVHEESNLTVCWSDSLVGAVSDEMISLSRGGITQDCLSFPCLPTRNGSNGSLFQRCIPTRKSIRYLTNSKTVADTFFSLTVMILG